MLNDHHHHHHHQGSRSAGDRLQCQALFLATLKSLLSLKNSRRASNALCLSHACIAFRQHVVDLMMEYVRFDEERRFYCDRAVAPRDLLLHISAGLEWTLQGDTPCGYTAPQRARL